ncbi:TetR/AcrR family transcriptional regulator [Niallia sp. Krafla_26]|uniref:TetR/AcrR family transcriptional regulator n=1 Tax=Niallia sp. Krafla_26 TaxID=3064703 RepID=UPI003D16EAA0
MDTKSVIINTATTLFQQKGYKSVGLNEILKACKITKGALYHHFPNGKEELLIACLRSMNEAITDDMEAIFSQYSTTLEATLALIEELIARFDREGTITGYTFTSIVREMESLSEPVRNASNLLYSQIIRICSDKLVADGMKEEHAYSTALMMTASIEGGILLCLAKKDTIPLQTVMQFLPNILHEN